MHNPALYYFAGAILVTLVTTVLLCRRCIARRKRSFFLLALTGDLLVNAGLYCSFYQGEFMPMDGVFLRVKRGRQADYTVCSRHYLTLGFS
jgi:hypothetical protein